MLLRNLVRRTKGCYSENFSESPTWALFACQSTSVDDCYARVACHVTAERLSPSSLQATSHYDEETEWFDDLLLELEQGQETAEMPAEMTIGAMSSKPSAVSSKPSAPPTPITADIDCVPRGNGEDRDFLDASASAVWLTLPLCSETFTGTSQNFNRSSSASRFGAVDIDDSPVSFSCDDLPGLISDDEEEDDPDIESHAGIDDDDCCEDVNSLHIPVCGFRSGFYWHPFGDTQKLERKHQMCKERGHLTLTSHEDGYFSDVSASSLSFRSSSSDSKWEQQRCNGRTARTVTISGLNQWAESWSCSEAVHLHPWKQPNTLCSHSQSDHLEASKPSEGTSTLLIISGFMNSLPLLPCLADIAEGDIVRSWHLRRNLVLDSVDDS